MENKKRHAKEKERSTSSLESLIKSDNDDV